MRDNKIYKIIIPILCCFLVLAQVLCFYLSVAIELNVVIDVIAFIVSLIFVVFLKEEKEIDKSSLEVKEDLKEGISKLENFIDTINENKTKKE